MCTHFVERLVVLDITDQQTGIEQSHSHRQQARYVDAMEPKMAAALADAVQLIQGFTFSLQPCL